MSKANLTNGVLSVTINTMEHYFGCFLQPIQNRQRENAPTHEVVAKKSNGMLIKIGIAWERALQRGDNRGKAMYSLLLDDPMFKEKMSFSCFPEGEEGEYSVNYERPRGNKPENNSTISELAPPEQASAA